MPSRWLGADTTVASSMVSPRRTTTAPSANLASLPVSMEMTRPSGSARVLVMAWGWDISGICLEKRQRASSQKRVPHYGARYSNIFGSRYWVFGIRNLHFVNPEGYPVRLLTTDIRLPTTSTVLRWQNSFPGGP